MRRLQDIAWRGLRRRPLRSGLTIAGIALGAGLVFAALATDAGIDAAVQRSVREIAGRTDLVVDAFDEHGLNAASRAAVVATAGIVVATPSVQRHTFASSLQRGVLGEVLLIGVDPDTDPALHDTALTGGVRLASGDDAGLLVASSWAAAHGIGLGSQVSLVGAGGQHEFTVRGLLAQSGRAVAESGHVALSTLAAAQSLFALGDAVDRIECRVDAAVGTAEVERRLEANLTAQPYLLATTGDQIASLDASTTEFRSSTLLIATVALFVGGFLIFNTISMTVVERVREVGLLRAAGATRGQVLRLFVVEAALLGAAGTLLGLLVGLAFAAGMAAYVRSVEGIPSGDPVVFPGAFLATVVLGMLVTIAAALEPAWQAGRIQPIEALRARRDAGSQIGSRFGWFAIVSAALVVGGIALSPSQSSGGGSVARPVAVFALLLVAAICSPLALGVLGRIAGVAFGRVFRAEGRLARGALARDRGRTAVTLGALTVGIAMVVAVAAVAQDARRAGDAWLNEVVPGDYVASAFVTVPANLSETFAAVPGVASVTPVRTFEIDVSGQRVDAAGIDPQAFAAAGAFEVVGADRGAAFAALQAGGACLIPQSRAAGLGVSVGGSLVVRTSGGDRTFKVAGLVLHSLPGEGGESVVFSSADAAGTLGASGASFFAIRTVPGAPAGVRDALTAVAGQYALQVSDRGSVASAIEDSLGRVFGLFDALALVAVVVAGLGIVNTLTMDVYERVREIGVLRAAGMTRPQVWRMVVIEAGILGSAGAIMGVVSGLIVGAAMLSLTSSAGFRPPLDVPWVAVGIALVLGIAVAMVAAAYPARLASRVPIVRALRFE